jgi:iron complex outermembrane receptor protein
MQAFTELIPTRPDLHPIALSLAVSVAAGNILSPGHALAAQNTSERQLEEVIVVAQRRAESAQLTPISLASFDQKALDVLGISTIDDIGAQVPNFVIDQFPSSNQTLRLYIRGVGVNDVQITQDPAVGVYLDGVYLARSTGLASEVADLERIEVLRGPQGTLYGRNTTGGALNLVSVRPDLNRSAFKLQLGAGNRNQLRGKATLNLPLGSGHALKLATIYDRRDGFMDNGGPGGDFGDRKATGYRLDWRWQPNKDFALDYAWDKSDIESYNYTPQAQIPGVEMGNQADAAVRSSRRFVPYGRDRFHKLSTSVPLIPNDTDIQGHALTMEFQRANYTLKSITAWRELEDLSYIDFASGASEEYRVDFHDIELGSDTVTPLNYDTVRTRLEQEQFSQEFQIFGEINDGLEYVAGLYYFREEARENWFPMHHIFSFPVIETNDMGQAINIRAEDNEIENQALALYGQMTWTPKVRNSGLHFSFGWRYSEDEREVQRLFRQDNFVDFGNEILGPFETINFSSKASRDFDDNSFSFMVEYDWTQDFHAYGKYIEAYKSGGFNTRDPDPEFFAQGFDEEKNQTVELGFKGELLNRQLRVNGAVFYSEFDDLQLNFLLPGGISDTRVFNSGSATLSGFEMELLAFPWHGLLCGLNYAYLDSEIDDVVDPFTGNSRSFAFTNAPRHTASLNIDYQFPRFKFALLSANFNVNYVDERAGDNERTARDDYTLVNGRLALSDIPLLQGQFAVSAWVKNALGEDYVSFAIDNLPHASRAVLWGETRTWGIELRYTY